MPDGKDIKKMCKGAWTLEKGFCIFNSSYKNTGYIKQLLILHEALKPKRMIL